VYVLESILIHKGGAYGGHYYSYIMKEEKWWKFDDNRVSRVWDMDEMIEDCRHNGYMLNYMK
jgi:ubiquitin C-terminal hydrolase